MNPVQNKIVIMFIMMAVGFICGKTGLIDSSGNQKLSRLSLMLVNPLLTFMSYQSEYSPEISKNLLVALGLTLIIFALQIAAATVAVPKKCREYAVERMSLIFSNCGFIGIPLVESIYGSTGIIYLTMFITVFNILLWTYGVSLMTGKASLRRTLKNFFTPAIISVVLGLIFYFCRISIPSIISEPLNSIGSMNTPLAMLVAGSTLAGTNLLKGFKKPKLYYLCLMRLIVIPVLAVLSVFWTVRLGADPMTVSVVIIAASCPSAVVTTMFAHTHNRDSAWPSEIFAVTTLLSAFTIPAIMWFSEIMGISL